MQWPIPNPYLCFQWSSVQVLDALAINSNLLTGTVPEEICASSTLQFMTADCLEIECPCCTVCCDRQGCSPVENWWIKSILRCRFRNNDRMRGSDAIRHRSSGGACSIDFEGIHRSKRTYFICYTFFGQPFTLDHLVSMLVFRVINLLSIRIAKATIVTVLERKFATDQIRKRSAFKLGRLENFIANYWAFKI